MEGGPPSFYYSRREGGEQPHLVSSGGGRKKKRMRCVMSPHDENGDAIYDRERASSGGGGPAQSFENMNDTNIHGEDEGGQLSRQQRRKRRKAEDFKKLKRDLEEVSKVVQQHLDELSRSRGLNLAAARTEILHKLEHHLKKQSNTFSEEELEMALKLMPPNSSRESAQRVLVLKNELAKLRNRGLNTTAAIDELFRRFDVLGIKPAVGIKRKSSNNINTQDPSQQLLAQQQQLQMLQQHLERTKRQRQNDYDVGSLDHQFDFFVTSSSRSQEDFGSIPSLSSAASGSSASTTSPSRWGEPSSSPPRGWTFSKRKRSPDKPSSPSSKLRGQHLAAFSLGSTSSSAEGENDYDATKASECVSPITKRQRMEIDYAVPSDQQTQGRYGAHQGEEETEGREKEEEEEEEEEGRYPPRALPFSLLGTEKENCMSNFAPGVMPVHSGSFGGGSLAIPIGQPTFIVDCNAFAMANSSSNNTHAYHNNTTTRHNEEFARLFGTPITTTIQQHRPPGGGAMGDRDKGKEKEKEKETEEYG